MIEMRSSMCVTSIMDKKNTFFLSIFKVFRILLWNSTDLTSYISCLAIRQIVQLFVLYLSLLSLFPTCYLLFYILFHFFMLFFYFFMILNLELVYKQQGKEERTDSPYYNACKYNFVFPQAHSMILYHFFIIIISFIFL